MTTDEPDELPPRLREALHRLPLEADPPPALEARIVHELRLSEDVRSWRRAGRLRRQAITAALAIVSFAGGYALHSATATRGASAADPRFLLLLYGEGKGLVAGTNADLEREYAAWARSAHADGTVLGGEELAGEIVAVPAGSTVEHEPGSAADELVSGYFVLQARDLTNATRLAATCPHLRHGGRVLLRAITPS